MSRFNIGDRVEVFKPDSKYYGRVGIVDGITNIRGCVKIAVKFRGYCTPWAYDLFELDDIVSVCNLKKAYDDYISKYEGTWDSKCDLQYVKVPENHIVIDFDIPNADRRTIRRDAFYGVDPGSNHENFWSTSAYHLYTGTKYEPNVVYLKRDEQVVKDTIKNLMEENNMSKFRIGDVVIVKNNVEAVYTDGKYAVGNPGDIGIVNRIEHNFLFPERETYYIQFVGHIGLYTMRAYELDLYSNPRSSGRYHWNDSSNNIPKIKKVIFNCPATIVLFEDGTKSVVKIDENDPVWDPEHGLAMALVKRVYGTNKSHSNYYDIFKKWLPKEEEEKSNDNNPCTNCPDRKTGCLTNCKKMQEYADNLYNATKDHEVEVKKKSFFDKHPLKIEDDRVKEIEKKFGEKVRAMREKNKPEEVKKGFIGDFYFKKDYMAQMSPIEFLTFCRENRLMFYLENCETAIDPDACSWQQIFSYLKKGKLSATTKTKYVCNAQFRGDKLIDAVDVNYVVFSKKQQ